MSPKRRRQPHLRLYDCTTGLWADWVGEPIPPLEPRRTRPPFDLAAHDPQPDPPLRPFPLLLPYAMDTTNTADLSAPSAADSADMGGGRHRAP